MNRKKFQKRCEELIEYEQEILARAKKLSEGKEKILDEHGLTYAAYLCWSYLGGGNSSLKRIDFKECYTCSIFVAICKKEDDPYDVNLEAVSLIYPVTDLRKGFFSYKFERLKNFEACESTFTSLFEQVVKEGYEQTLKNYRL